MVSAIAAQTESPCGQAIWRRRLGSSQGFLLLGASSEGSVGGVLYAFTALFHLPLVLSFPLKVRKSGASLHISNYVISGAKMGTTQVTAAPIVQQVVTLGTGTERQ